MDESKMYKVGDTIYSAGWTNHYYSVPCPDCCGKKYLTVIMGDDSWRMEIIIRGMHDMEDSKIGFWKCGSYCRLCLRFIVIGFKLPKGWWNNG